MRRTGIHAFNTDTVRDLTDGESGGKTCTLAFDHIAFEGLNTLLVAFNDLIVDGNIVTSLEVGELLFACQLLVYVMLWRS